MIIKAKTQQAKGLGHQNLDLSFTKCITPNRVSKKFRLWFRIYSVPKTVGAQWQRELKRGCSCIHLCVREWNGQNQDHNGRLTSKAQQVVGILLPRRRKEQRKKQTVKNCTILVPKNSHFKSSSMLLPSKQYTVCPVIFISTSQHFTQGQISHIKRGNPRVSLCFVVCSITSILFLTNLCNIV